MQQRKEMGKKLPSLETVFALIVIAACFFSILIANISQRRQIHERSHKIGVVGKNAEFKNQFAHHDERKANMDKTKFAHEGKRKAKIDKPRSSGHPISKVKPISPVSKLTKQKAVETRGGVVEEANGSSPLHWFKPLPLVPPSPQLLQSKHPKFEGYLIENGNHCKDQRVDILIYFHSTAAHYHTRSVLRQTWAGRNNFKDIRVKAVFFLGEPENAEDAPGIPLEFSTHGDIVQGNFPDTFKTLSIKAIMASHWILQHCAHARYIIKADDDVFLDIFRTVEKLVPQIYQSKTTFICHFQKNNSKEIQRNPDSKWYVPETLLSKRKYHMEFCSGYLLLFTADLIPIIYRGSLKAELVPVDDVFLFGLSIQSSGIVKFIDIARNVSLGQDTMMQQFRRNITRTIIGTGTNNEDALRGLWRESVKALTLWGLEHASRQLVHQRLNWISGRDLDYPRH